MVVNGRGEVIDPLPDPPRIYIAMHGPKELRCEPRAVESAFAMLPCQAGRWTIRLSVLTGFGDFGTLGSGTVDVVPGSVVELRIRVDL